MIALSNKAFLVEQRARFADDDWVQLKVGGDETPTNVHRAPAPLLHLGVVQMCRSSPMIRQVGYP